jgi:hypothetical protein
MGKSIFRTGLITLALAFTSPLASFGQSCPAGQTAVPLPSPPFAPGQTGCELDGTVPEMSASSGALGLALAAGVFMVIRGRKRVQIAA